MATFTWIGGTSQDWLNPANWLADGVPATVAPNDPTAIVIDNFDNGANDAIISGGASVTVASLSIGNFAGVPTPGAVGGHVIVGGGPQIGGGGGGTLTSLGAITVASTNSGGGLVGGPASLITAPTLTIGAGAIIGGGGVFNITNLVNSGIIQADGGDFALGALGITGGSITGTGSLEVDGTSSLSLSSATAETITVIVGGQDTATVALQTPATFTGALNLTQPSSHMIFCSAAKRRPGHTLTPRPTPSLSLALAARRWTPFRSSPTAHWRSRRRLQGFPDSARFTSGLQPTPTSCSRTAMVRWPSGR